MQLNACRDEAGAFLAAIQADHEPIAAKLDMLREELYILEHTPPENRKAVGHQVYDMLFLLFEIASQSGADLDAEWEAGKARKAAKYL